MRLIALAVLALFVSPAPAAFSCSGPASGASEAVKLGRPSDGVLKAAFGMRTHPILGLQRLHTGVDYAAETGAPVTAAADGRVIEARYKSQYGNYVRIDHGAGITTAYAHMSRIDVHEGDCVAAAAPLGAVGCTGLCSEPHLHFEVQRDGHFVDPLNVMKAAAH